MTVIYILAIILQAWIIYYFISKSRKKANQAENKASVDLSTYDGVRDAALNVSPADLKLNIPASQVFVYGVVMDWDMSGTMLTLAAYITGAANVYLSSGPGITGGGKNPEVGELAVRFVSDAQDFLGRAIQVPQAAYPTKGCVRFHLLTNQGVYDAQELLIHIEDTTSPWLSLFIRGNNVINEMKQGEIQVTENQ